MFKWFKEKIEKNKQEKEYLKEIEKNKREEEENRLREIRIKREQEKQQRLQEEKKERERKFLQQKRELEEKKKKEQIELDNMLSEEMKNNYKGIYKMWGNISHGINFSIQILSKFNKDITEESINDTFLEIYKISKNINDLQAFDNAINDKRMKIIENKLKFAPKYYSGANMSSLQYMEKVLDIYDKIKDTIMVEGASGTLELMTSVINMVTEAETDEFRELTSTSLAIIILYLHIEALIRTIVLFRKEKSLKECEEFYKIQKNLFNEFSLEEMAERLYPIYEQFYVNTFNEKLDIKCLKVLVYMINCKEDNLIGNNFIDTLNNIAIENNDIELQQKLKNLNSYSDIYFIISRFVDFDIINESNLNDTLIIYLEILGEIKDTIKGSEIVSLYFSSIKILDDIKIYTEKKRLLEDKQRYLECNFDKEKKIKNEKLKFDLIYNGIQFEQYLKYLFEKLGYVVETTKTTGDQGADLILNKNNIKTVVQAKFYSNPVGNKAVQEVVSAIKFYKADNGMVVTNNYYTKSAKELAEANEIELWDKDILDEIIMKM